MGHENVVEDVPWNLKDENMFGSSEDDCKLIIWDLRTNKAQQSVKPHEKEFAGLLINMEPQFAIKKDATEVIYFVIITFYFAEKFKKEIYGQLLVLVA
ncbi:hypothetical protein AAZX31_18G113700 [Glycine max]